MDGLDIINILDGLNGCPSDRMDWILDGLLTTLQPVREHSTQLDSATTVCYSRRGRDPTSTTSNKLVLC